MSIVSLGDKVSVRVSLGAHLKLEQNVVFGMRAGIEAGIENDNQRVI